MFRQLAQMLTGRAEAKTLAQRACCPRCSQADEAVGMSRRCRSSLRVR